MEVWKDYYTKSANRRKFPDEDLCRFLAFCGIPNHTLTNVLDIGCGDFRNGQAFRAWLPDALVVGIDLFADQDLFDEAGTYSVAIPLGWEKYFADQVQDQDLLILNSQGWAGGPSKWFYEHDIVTDVMTSQHFSWADHYLYFRKVAEFLKPHGWFFLKHLTWECSDRTLAEPIDENHYTFRNIPSHKNACYPDNGLVCMPTETVLWDLLDSCGLDVKRQYTVLREEFCGVYGEKRFAHGVFFCEKP